MWKANDKKVPGGKGGRMDKVDTLISSNVTITGDILFSGGIQIDGTVIGNIVADEDSESVEVGKKKTSSPMATVRVTKQGRVKGQIHGPKVIIDGSLDGDVISTNHLELSSNAVVTGNVHYHMVEIMVGAQVNGSIAHIAQQSTAAEQDSGEAKLATDLADIGKMDQEQAKTAGSIKTETP